MRTLPGKPYCCLSPSTWTFCALASRFCSAHLQFLRCCFRNMLLFETCFAFVCIFILFAWIVPLKPSCPRFFNSPNPTAEDDAFAVMETVAAEETGCFLEPSLFKARLDSKCPQVDAIWWQIYKMIFYWLEYVIIIIITSSTAQGGGGSFKNRKL